MRLSRSVNLVSKFKHEIEDCYSQARIYKLSHARLLENLSRRIWGTVEYNHLPVWAQSQLGGYADCRLTCCQRHELEWRICYLGIYADGANVPKGEWDKVTEGAFFWKGTDAMFNPKEERNAEVQP